MERRNGAPSGANNPAPKQLNPLAIARDVLQTLRLDTPDLTYRRSEFGYSTLVPRRSGGVVWTENRWREVDKANLRSAIWLHLEALSDVPPRKRDVDEVVDALKAVLCDLRKPALAHVRIVA
jgi:hypothetical protein